MAATYLPVTGCKTMDFKEENDSSFMTTEDKWRKEVEKKCKQISGLTIAKSNRGDKMKTGD